MAMETASTELASAADVEPTPVGYHTGRGSVLQHTRPNRQRRLSSDQIRMLSRDLRVLIATNGTLTRILGVVVDEEIGVQVIEQQIHPSAPKILQSEQLPSGRILQRNVVLKGRRSGRPYIAAETLAAIDFLPPTIVTSLVTTDRPIGELLVSASLETLKELPEVWMGEHPSWGLPTGHANSRLEAVGRRYRQFIGGQPVITISEYFPLDVFSN
ncbi:chorismate--pyruvate lyase family protein [Mycobacterium riyadhense]|uniref:Chorismate pyruvate-lyase n=2 Tax=Mycobacterium riyadhense TaxID=486698 RepID=A0A653EBZ0_9MYCO|nr:chorismate pyruvate-lyase family protein [Mycobacterium riyadhense]VTO94894.1 Chorismate pyruvate-lyase [Mycobacterium riyadhense]